MKIITLKIYLLFFIATLYGCTAKDESTYKISNSIDSSFLQHYDKSVRDDKWLLNLGGKNDDSSQLVKKYSDYRRNNLAILYIYYVDSTGKSTGSINDSAFGLCQCKKVNDTIEISAAFGFFGGYGISIKIKGEEYAGEFSEHAKDALFAATANQINYTTDITVGQENQKLILSKKLDFVAAGNLFGQYEGLFKPYFERNVGTKMIRQKVKLIFKCTL